VPSATSVTSSSRDGGQISDRAAQDNFRPRGVLWISISRQRMRSPVSVFFARDLFLARHDGLGLAEIDVQIIALATAHVPVTMLPTYPLKSS